jgi:S1-C subfamily serine protease
MIGGGGAAAAVAATLGAASPPPAVAAPTAAQLTPPLAAATPLSPREQALVDAASRAARAVARVTDVSLPRANASAGAAQAVVGVPQGNGSGVVVDGARRLLATNYHVLAASLEKLPPDGGGGSGDESKQPKVALVTFFEDGEEEEGGAGGGAGAAAGRQQQRRRATYDGFLVGYDRARDLALLRVGGGGGASSSTPLPSLQVAPASSLRVGQAVLAIGSPFGFDGSVSAGVVSALGVAIPSLARPGATLTGCVAFDAAANPGSSGGALVDSAGRLVGMPTAIFTPTGVSAGQGFAIPAEAVARAAASLAAGARVTGAGLGVVVASEAVKARLGISAIPGALLQAARPGGAADRAGLKATRREAGGIVAGDVIASVDGRLVSGASDLAAALAERAAGEAVRLGVVRGGGGKQQREEEVEAVLDDE